MKDISGREATSILLSKRESAKHAAIKSAKGIFYLRKKSYLSWPSSMPPLKPIEVVPKSMWRIHCDILGPLQMSRNGNQYVAIGVCSLLKYIEAMRN